MCPSHSFINSCWVQAGTPHLAASRTSVPAQGAECRGRWFGIVVQTHSGTRPPVFGLRLHCLLPHDPRQVAQPLRASVSPSLEDTPRGGYEGSVISQGLCWASAVVVPSTPEHDLLRTKGCDSQS